MGGSSGGRSRRSSAPSQPAPLDVGSIMAASSAAAKDQIKTQYEEMIKNYPTLESLSLGTVRNISGMLGGTAQPVYEMRETKNKQGKVTGYERVQVGMSEPNQQTADALASIRKAMALGEMDPNAAMPTSIEQGLYDAGERELALGRSLSPQQIRESQQAARSAFAARGLGTSMPAAAAEILNRDAMASARERERQAFASQQNTMLMGNVMGRRGALADLYMAGAGNLIAADPLQRAVAPGLGLGQGTQGNMMQLSGQTFASANELAGAAAAANASMQADRYTNWANMQAAREAAGAMRQSGMYGMIGGIGGGLLSGVGMGLAMSDKREKTEIKPLGKSGSVLGLKTYSYKYRGDDKPRVGVMAQDVAKVLPQAVQEVNYRGKKRLAIKPAVIGAALAEELAAQAA